MAEPQNLSNAPIIEALIDFRVDLPEAIDVSVLAKAHEQIKDEYPHVQTQRTFKGQVNFADNDFQGVQQVGDPATTGYFYKTADQTRLVQFRLDGFTFNQLKPYSTWEEVFPEALRLWQIYCSLCSPKAINRLATRYINQIAIPTPFDSFRDFLTVAPQVPPNTSPNIAGFLNQVTVQEDGSDIFTTITQTLAPESNEEHAVVLLDIDVFKNFDALRPENEEVVTETFSNLREIKNRTFFSSITERAVGLFQ